MSTESIDGVEYNSDLTKIIKVDPSDISTENIIIEEWVEELSVRSFFYCRFISNVKLSKKLKRIGDWCFEGCANLQSIKCYGKLEYVGAGAFYNCSSLNSVTLNNKIKALYQLTFAGCVNLKKIKIPSSVLSINSSCFKRCYSLIEVEYSGVKYKCQYDALNDVILIEGLGAFDGMSGGKLKSLPSIK